MNAYYMMDYIRKTLEVDNREIEMIYIEPYNKGSMPDFPEGSVHMIRNYPGLKYTEAMNKDVAAFITGYETSRYNNFAVTNTKVSGYTWDKDKNTL